MLIFYGALNDLTVREWLSSDCYRGLNPQRGLNGQRGLFVERNAKLPASALYRLVAISLDWMSNPWALDSSFEPSRVQCERDPGDTTLETRLVANSPIYFERNIRNLVTLALAHDVQPVISTWVYNIEADRPQLWRQSIAQHNAVTRQVATDMDIPYINLAAEFPVDSSYWELDGVHLVAAGTYEQASRYAAFLDDAGLLPTAENTVRRRRMNAVRDIRVPELMLDDHTPTIVSRSLIFAPGCSATSSSASFFRNICHRQICQVEIQAHKIATETSRCAL